MLLFAEGLGEAEDRGGMDANYCVRAGTRRLGKAVMLGRRGRLQWVLSALRGKASQECGGERTASARGRGPNSGGWL